MSVSLPRLLPSFLALLGLLAGPSAAAPAATSSPAPAAEGRLVVLGFDGADARTARELMEAGQLPNLQRLAETGTFHGLTPTASAESPVSWASLNCGQNPAKTGVPGFVRRHFAPGNRPFPFFGHLEMDVATPVEHLHNAPVPTWSATKLGGALGAATFLVFAVVFGLLLRLRPVTTVVLSLVLGGLAFAGGSYWRGLLPTEVPRVANVTKTAPFWEVAGKAGVSSIVLDAAQAWDREPVDNVRLLAGLGVPDARGGVQSFFIYTTDELWPHEPPHTRSTDTGSGGDKFRVYEQNGRIQSLIYGPRNHYEVDRLQQKLNALQAQKQDADPRSRAELGDRERELQAELEAAKGEEGRVTADLVVERQGDDAVAVTLGTETQVLKEGEWSDWYHLTFDLNPVVKVKAITRAKVISLNAPFELYVNTLEIDPAAAPFWQPISQPYEFAAELESEIGPYETIGWACMTMPFKDEVIDPVTFMEDIEFTMRWREKMLRASLERDDWRLLFSVLSTPDRVQHMMYQFYDEQHPMYDAATAGREMTFFGETITLQDAIPAIYRQVDRVVGEVMDEYLRPDDTLLICADHGFQSFRRGVNINNWLYENGYLAVKSNLGRNSTGGLAFVDWSRTKAYSLGLGMVYVNQAGREAGGIVAPDEVDELLSQIREDFVATVDPETGLSMGKDARIMRQIQSGPYADLSPDMMLGFDVGYRVSWRTTTGGMKLSKQDDGTYAPGGVFEDSNKNWSGDHVSVDPTLVQGMFFSNRKVAIPDEGVHVMHIAPTALAVLGVPVPAEYDKQPLAFE